MSINIVKDSIDLGIITTNPEPMLRFYRDTLGLKPGGDMEIPGGGQMIRLLCGTTVLKLVVNGQPPEQPAVPGGISGAAGYRYWTISVDNLQESVQECRDAGYNIAMEPQEIREGVTFTVIEDPDGNWVELLEMAE